MELSSGLFIICIGSLLLLIGLLQRASETIKCRQIETPTFLNTLLVGGKLDSVVLIESDAQVRLSVSCCFAATTDRIHFTSNFAVDSYEARRGSSRHCDRWGMTYVSPLVATAALVRSLLVGYLHSMR
jgi:hypothetical protein